MDPEPQQIQFRVGQQVVCINDRFPMVFTEWADYIPREGAVYTVRWAGTANDGITGVPGPAIMLCEIVNPMICGRSELSFNSARFRPLSADQSGRVRHRNQTREKSKELVMPLDRAGDAN